RWRPLAIRAGRGGRGMGYHDSSGPGVDVEAMARECGHWMERAARLEAATRTLTAAAQEVVLDDQFPSRTMEDNTFHLKREHRQALAAAVRNARAALAPTPAGEGE